jgi:purine-binding chemotaxis protein CheW
MNAHDVNTADVIQVVVFRVGSQEFALDILQVERILRYEKPAALPQAPEFLEGVVRYEGTAVPVVDLRKRLEVDAAVRDETRLMIVLIDEQRVGVLVDEVREVLRVDSTTITAPPPMVRGLAATYISGIIARADRTIVVLNASRLLTSTERVALHVVGS